jgi:hypothetical protein
MDPNETNETPAEPDMIAQVGVMLTKMTHYEWVSSGLEAEANEADAGKLAAIRRDERTIVVASAILAVAAELRAVRNELVEFQLAWKVRQ